jgi:putative component of toxin-antitoxin plasmid stabilization module
MPHSRSVGGGLFELRFDIKQGLVAQRITSGFEPGTRIITLTTFQKTTDNERTQIARARKALKAWREQRKNR